MSTEEEATTASPWHRQSPSWSDVLEKLAIGRKTSKHRDNWSAGTPPPYSNSGFFRGGRGRYRGDKPRATTTATTDTQPSSSSIADDHDHHQGHHNHTDSSSEGGRGAGTQGGGNAETEILVDSGNKAGGTYDVHTGDEDHDHGDHEHRKDPDHHEDHGNHGDHDENGDRDNHGQEHDHNTDHEGFSCQPTSSQHSAYIEAHLEELQKKCNEFHECTIELYNAENFHRVLAGEPLQLSNICGLMYPEGQEVFTTGNQSVKCSMSERVAIREDIGRRLSREMMTSDKLRSLKDCVEKNRNATESDVDTVCRLAETQTTLCEKTRVHTNTEHFFNHEMEHLHCSCAAIRAQAQKPQADSNASRLPKELRIAIGSGVVGLLFILIIVVIILCIRHRKVKKRLDQHRMKYLPSPHDEGSAIYQEINDRPQGLYNGKNDGSMPGGYHFLGRAPSLPERYVKPDISRSRSNLNTPGEDEREYLEPLPDAGPGSKGKNPAALANMGYRTPRTLDIREPPYDLAKHPPSNSPTDGRPPESNYFDRLQLRNGAEEDGGYSTLGRKFIPADSAHDELEGGQNADGSQYFVLEPEDDVTSEKDVLNVVTSM